MLGPMAPVGSKAVARLVSDVAVSMAREAVAVEREAVRVTHVPMGAKIWLWLRQLWLWKWYL